MKIPKQVKKILETKDFVRITYSGNYYDSNDKKITSHDANMGIRDGKYLFTCENAGGYNWGNVFTCYVKDKNNRYFDIYYFSVDTRIKNRRFDCIRPGYAFWWSNADLHPFVGTRIYSDRTSVDLYCNLRTGELRGRGKDKYLSRGLSDDTFNQYTKPMEYFDEHKESRYNKLVFSSLNYPDISNKTIFYVSNVTNYYRIWFSDYQKNIIKDVLKDSIEKYEYKYNTSIEVDSPKKLSEILRASLKTNESRKITERGLIDIKRDITDNIEYVGNSYIIRYDDYIVFGSSRRYTPTIFYNAKTKKKFALSADGLMSVVNIRTDFLSEMKTIKEFYSNSYNNEYENPYSRLYDKNGNEIDYKTAFADTIGIDYVENIIDCDESIFSRTYAYSSISCKYTTTSVSKKPIKELIKDGFYPNEVFAYICCRSGYEKITEQLIKAKKFNLLRAITFSTEFIDENKIEERDTCAYTPINLKGKSPSKILNITNSKINLIENIYSQYKSDPLKDSTFKDSVNQYGKVLNPYDSSHLNFKSIFETFNVSDELLMKLINYLKLKTWSTQSEARRIEEIYKETYNGSTKNLEKMLNILPKLSYSSMYFDYLRMRKQYIDHFGTNDIKHYPIFPEKSNIFKRRLNNQSEFSFKQNILSTCYESCVEYVYDDNKSIIGAYLSLDEGQNTKYLHDELQNIISAISNQIKEEAFQRALKRSDKFVYRGKELSVIRPNEINDLVNEGSTLSHCVRSFVDPIISGTENVLFIRRNDMLDVPYYTMAISNDGVIGQIHCYRNSGLSKENQEEAYKTSKIPSYDKTFDLVAFLKEWAKNVGVDTRQITEQYGIRGARRY